MGILSPRATLQCEMVTIETGVNYSDCIDTSHLRASLHTLLIGQINAFSDYLVIYRELLFTAKCIEMDILNDDREPSF